MWRREKRLDIAGIDVSLGCRAHSTTITSPCLHFRPVTDKVGYRSRRAALVRQPECRRAGSLPAISEWRPPENTLGTHGTGVGAIETIAHGQTLARRPEKADDRSVACVAGAHFPCDELGKD